jgi:hypothetical protein
MGNGGGAGGSPGDGGGAGDCVGDSSAVDVVVREVSDDRPDDNDDSSVGGGMSVGVWLGCKTAVFVADVCINHMVLRMCCVRQQQGFSVT